jgi:TatD DNase family protein
VTLRLYDSHCHLHDRSVVDVEAQIARATVANVTAMLLAGVMPEGWRDAVALRERFPQLRVAFGVHPQVIEDEQAPRMVDALSRALDGALPRPSAIGEIGLDGMPQNVERLPMQEVVFRRQLALATRHRLPVVLHVLRAHPRALEILEDEEGMRGVLHSCSASVDQVKRYLKLGLYVSFSAAATNDNARRLRDSLCAVPLDRLLVETDAPFQTPAARRPARNEPAFLVEIVAALAQIRGEQVERVAEATFANARRLFDEE